MNQITAIFVDYDVLYSRLWNKRSPLNKHSPWNIWKNNKHSPLKKHIPLHQITELQLFLWITLFNKEVAPGKKPKN